MVYGCIECGLIWCDESDYDKLTQSDIKDFDLQEVSHGICPECFQVRKADKVHSHQRKNGYSECYNKSNDCTNTECLFWSTCGSNIIDEWKSKIKVVGSNNNPL